MKDQAELLRRKLSGSNNKASKTIAVVSGKGGVGKSNFSLNFSIALSKKGSTVLLFDLDMGMGNLDILMGKASSYTIADFFDGTISLKQSIMRGPEGMCYISGGSGLSKIISLDDELIDKFMKELSDLIKEFDYIIFDMGAGISETSIKFILSVQEIFVIITPEPTSITDAYSIMKHIHLLDDKLPLYLLINRVQSEKEGQQTITRISNVLKKFLGRDSIPLGILPDDRMIQQAVYRQIPFILYNEKSSAAKSLIRIAERYQQRNFSEIPNLNSLHFIFKLKRLLFERQ